MTRYKLTRSGPIPSVTYAQRDSNDSAESCLRSCFEFCKPAVRMRLERWLCSKERVIRFRFAGYVVQVERVE